MIVIPTLHPGLLSRSGDDDGFSKYEHVVVGDMAKAARLMHSLPQWNEEILYETDNAGRRWRIFPTPNEVQWFFERFYAACARHPQWVERGLLSLTVDVETTKDAPLLSQLICVGLGFKAPDEEQVINVPILCCGGFRYWATEDNRTEQWVRQMVGAVLADPRVPKSFHNKAFDMAVLWANSMPVAGPTWDTMAAHHIEDGEMPHNLGFVSSTKTDGRFWKDDSKGDGGFLAIPDDTLRTYNLRDILVTQRIQHPLHEGLRARNQWALYIEQLENIDVMCRASIRGMLIDEQKRTSRELDDKGNFIGLQPKLEKQRDDAMMMLRQVSGNAAFDPGKPAQLQDLFFRQLGFPVVVTSQKTGKPKVDKEALMLLELMATTPEQRTALRGVIEFRQAEKFLGTFITGLGKFVHPATWRFHTQWKLLAVSGRWTSSPNAQNWNSKVKSMFRAAPGFKFVGVDLSQAELRYIAYLARDAALLQMYEQNINVHTVNACLLFKIQCPKKDDSNPQTDAFIRSEMQRIHGTDLSHAPMPPEANWKAIRTLAKNFVFGCVLEGTKVAVLDSRGGVPIEQVKAGDWTYSWDGVQYVPTRVKRVEYHGEQACVRLTLRAGDGKRKTLVVTPDHPMLTRDGRYVEAGALTPGARLMPFRRYTMKTGYREIDPQNDGGRAYEHRHLVPGFEVVHHSNGQRNDNRPENLVGMTHREHRVEHPVVVTEAGLLARAEAARVAMTPERLAMLREARLKSERFSAHASSLGRVHAAQAREAYRKQAAEKSCTACGGKPHFAKGLCQRCYNAGYRARLENHVVEAVEPLSDTHKVWDLEVEHEAHNFALEGSVFVGNCNYGAEAKTVYGILRAKRDAETNKLLFPSLLLSEVEALRIMWIRRLHPEIPRFWDDVQMQIRKAGGYFCPISGRARLFRGGFKRNEMLNIAIQMGVASWMNKKMVVIQRQFDRDTGGAAQIIQQVHDALNAECPDGYAVESGEIMRRELNEPFQLLGMNATLPADKALIHDYLHKV